MDLIIDANILFAALIKDSLTVDLIFNENLHLFAPEFLLEEFYKHKQEILNKTKRTEQDFEEIFNILKQIITIIPKEEFIERFEDAFKISPDKNDSYYFALALKFNIGIWSNDNDLKKQNKVKIYTTFEIKYIIS